jgi:hypothetical protein
MGRPTFELRQSTLQRRFYATGFASRPNGEQTGWSAKTGPLAKLLRGEGCAIERSEIMAVEHAGSISSVARTSQVMATETASRVTPNTPTFKEVMGASANVLLQGAAGAVRSLPASAIVAASVRPAGSSRTMATPSLAQAAAEGLGASGSVGSTTSSSGSGVESALAQSQDMNMYFIELQERLAAENRSFTTYSNVLKARHDTIKNAIGNIR